jgi:peptide/nickel transport system ATP-binding protein
MTVLEARSLKMYFSTKKGDVHAVDDVSFKLQSGRVLGLAGESGSGKTSIALTLLRLLPTNGRIISGGVYLDDENLLEIPEDVLRREIRWKRISMVPQAAMNALNPVFKVGDQIKEAILAHGDVDDATATQKTAELFAEVGISPERITSYPHEFSGGMKQRAMIAMALALNPDVLIADEPTTALDVIVQAQILVLLRELQRTKNMAMLLITHDLSLVAEMSTDVAIIYAGQIVEYAPATKIYHDPKHPYTIGLMKAFPNIEAEKTKTKLISIPGAPPDLVNLPTACRFADRCRFATSKCTSEAPPLLEVEQGHLSRCWYASDMHL